MGLAKVMPEKRSEVKIRCVHVWRAECLQNRVKIAIRLRSRGQITQGPDNRTLVPAGGRSENQVCTCLWRAECLQKS